MDVRADIHFVTYNLRFDSQPDSIPVAQSIADLPSPLPVPAGGYLPATAHQEKPWSLRRLRIAEQVLGGGADIVCVQEALVRQVRDLLELFGADWDWVGVGRDDGAEAGEFSAIFFKRSLFTALSHDFFWLSPTPFVPSRFPGAGSIRICTTLHLQHGPTGKRFTVMNTHLDERSEDQRRLAGSMILHRAQFEVQKSAGNPVFVLGDFNSPPQGADAGAYEIVTGTRAPEALPTDFTDRFPLAPPIPDFVLHDLRANTPRESVSANHATFTGFKAPNDTSSWTRIDFVFAGGDKGGWAATKYRVVDARADDGVLGSDHRPVFVDVKI